MNGKIVFGKFIPYKTVDVSCLVDVGGGKDLAALLVTEVDKLKLEDIADFIAKRAKPVKTEQDAEQKQRNGAVKFLPPV